MLAQCWVRTGWGCQAPSPTTARGSPLKATEVYKTVGKVLHGKAMVGKATAVCLTAQTCDVAIGVPEVLLGLGHYTCCTQRELGRGVSQAGMPGGSPGSRLLYLSVHMGPGSEGWPGCNTCWHKQMSGQGLWRDTQLMPRYLPVSTRTHSGNRLGQAIAFVSTNKTGAWGRRWGMD